VAQSVRDRRHADRRRTIDAGCGTRRAACARFEHGHAGRFHQRGLAQALAVVPGASRSGTTIAAGLFRNLDRESAARFSFLLSTPAIAAAAGKALHEIHKQNGLHSLLSTQFVVGVSVSALTGMVVIAWFLHYLHRSTLRPFIYYRIVFWHNSACSGFHPPASVMKLLSPTPHKG